MRYRVLRGEQLPRRLADMARPPECLHLWGCLPPEPYVAIVGSRGASKEACAFVTRLAAELAEAGVTVISGGAEGIDGAAHRGALEAKAPTLVVAPCGFDKPFPAHHAPLFRQIVEQGGGYLGLAPGESGARRPHFFRRNGVLAALCDALVLGEAGFRSGGRNATKQARLMGRAVFAVPSAPWNQGGRGSNLELRLGARWLEEARDVLRFLEERGALMTGELFLGQSVSGAQSAAVSAVGAALQAGQNHVDAICEWTQLPVADVNVALLELTLRGAVQADAQGLLRWLL